MSTRIYNNCTLEQLTEAVSASFSIAEVLRKIGLVPIGGNYATISRKIILNNLDHSHFTGQGWNKGKSLKDYQNYKKPKNLKLRLIKERGHKCQSCQLIEWLEELIPLELHHQDGNNLNNDPDNLQLLCPNCHSKTDNFRRRKDALIKLPTLCLDCQKVITPTSKRCHTCACKHRIETAKTNAAKPKIYKPRPTKIQWPSYEDLLNLVNRTSFVQAGKTLGVSDNAIRKALKRSQPS